MHMKFALIKYPNILQNIVLFDVTLLYYLEQALPSNKPPSCGAFWSKLLIFCILISHTKRIDEFIQNNLCWLFKIKDLEQCQKQCIVSILIKNHCFVWKSTRKGAPLPPINYWRKFPTQANFLKQYIYADFFCDLAKRAVRLQCLLFCKFV